MGKSLKEKAAQIQQTLIGNFRGALSKATPLEAIGMTETSLEESSTNTLSALEKGERAQFRQELLNDINNDLANFSMKVVSGSLQKIWDTSNYIANRAEKTLSVLKPTGKQGIQTYLIENFNRIVAPFTETMTLIPVKKLTVLTSVSGNWESISAIHPNAIELGKNELLTAVMKQALVPTAPDTHYSKTRIIVAKTQLIFSWFLH